jgi:hypothetical protein
VRGESVGVDEHAVYTADDNANLSKNSQKQGLPINVGPGLRAPREMATIGNLENMPSVLFNLWRK